MGADIDVCLLGALRVVRGGLPVAVTSPRVRALLVELALAPGRPVGVEALVNGVWGTDLPERAKSALHSLVARLRRLVGEDAIRTTPDGYLLDLVPGRVDVSRFLELLSEADRAVDRERERELLRAALALWRGDPVLPDRVPGLVERYLLAVQRVVDLDLDAGAGVEQLAVLSELVVRYPLREPLWERLIRALSANGRCAEALAAFAECRRTLSDELGVEPGKTLRRLHMELLADDGTPARPRQLPRDIGYFTGRAKELRELVAAVRGGARERVLAIDGMAGVGKTTLTIRAAHVLAADYDDGQVWLNLHAHTPGQEPLDSAAALDRLLRAVGVPDGQVPKKFDERIVLWRSRLAAQRMLIVLDNALDADHVRPLLPGTPGCLVIVTSRHRLTGLDGVRVTSLEVLPEKEAVELFGRVVGDGRAQARPAAAAEVVNLCGHLPLAIRIAASRLRHRTNWTVDRLVAKLHDEAGAAESEVDTALDMSYRQFDEDDAGTLFALLGVHPGIDVDDRAASALCSLPRVATEAMLQQLVDMHLLSEHVAGRYQMHDLVRAYAARSVSRDQAVPALARIADYYLCSAVVAMDLAFPRERRPARPEGVRPAVLADRGEAVAWLVTECANLIAVALRSSAHAVPISLALSRFLSITNRNDDAFVLHGHAWTVARRDGDEAEARVLNWLSEASWRTGRVAEATEHCERARELARSVGDQAAEAHATRLVGAVHFRGGNRVAAEAAYRSAIDLAHAAADLVLEGETWINLAAVVGADNRHAEAFDCALRAAGLATMSGDRHVAALALGSLGHACVEQGDHRRAIDYLSDAVTLGERTDAPKLRAHALYSLALAHHRLGEHGPARARYRAGLDLARAIGAPEVESVVLMGLGELALATGDTGGAITWQTEAITVADRFGEPFRRARAHDGLGDACRAAGDLAAAEENWRTALGIYRDVDAADADRVGSKLEKLTAI